MTNEEQKLREIEEGTPEIKRSELWNKIYSIVRQIPRENVNCDAMDASSASSEIERMVTALISENYYPKEFVKWTFRQRFMSCGHLDFDSSILDLDLEYWHEHIKRKENEQ